MYAQPTPNCNHSPKVRFVVNRPPEVSFDFWLDEPNRVVELGSEISDILIIRSDI